MMGTFNETRAFTSRDHLEKTVQAFQNDQKNLLQSNYSSRNPLFLLLETLRQK